jgi:arylsulfatase A-like enzyme
MAEQKPNILFIMGDDIGLRAEDPTVDDVMKSLGYATGQFGKNHLGDRNEFLPTAASFNLDQVMERMTAPKAA